MVRTRRLVGTLALTGGLIVGGSIFWDRMPRSIPPLGPNPFVNTVSLSTFGTDTAPFNDPIRISASHGVYALVRLERLPDLPPEFDGREVSRPERWPITLAIYRTGSSPENAVEFHCGIPGDGLVHIGADEAERDPAPMYLPSIGQTRGWTHRVGYSGRPALPQGAPGENVYWTFITAPDYEAPIGEYVYEIRLYPTARWQSAIRFERGASVVLARGHLIVADDSTLAHAEP